MNRPADYDDEKALDEYISRHLYKFKTPFEERAENFGMCRENALHNLRTADGPFMHVHQRRAAQFLAQYQQQTDAEVEAAIGPDLESVRAFQESIRQRVRSAFAKGDLQPPRCPVCNGILKTPLVRQCLWCGHDWHNA